MAWHADEARGAAARLRYGRVFRGAHREEGGGLQLADDGLRVRYLVGADGAHSTVARAFGLSRNREFSDGPDPARALAARYPRFVWKRALRRVADLPLPDWLFNALLGTSAARRIAGAIYFHRRVGDVEESRQRRASAEAARGEQGERQEANLE
jgi:2-polyprenyl-6-methoxyphenol hydroxylase-like FAD-dependent oxidoreductase